MAYQRQRHSSLANISIIIYSVEERSTLKRPVLGLWLYLWSYMHDKKTGKLFYKALYVSIRKRGGGFGPNKERRKRGMTPVKDGLLKGGRLPSAAGVPKLIE